MTRFRRVYFGSSIVVEIISTFHTQCSILETLSQRSKGQRLLMNPARLLLIAEMEKQEELWERTDEAASIYLSEEAMRAIAVCSKAMNAVFYIYEADFCDLKELYKAGYRGELAK